MGIKLHFKEPLSLHIVRMQYVKDIWIVNALTNEKKVASIDEAVLINS